MDSFCNKTKIYCLLGGCLLYALLLLGCGGDEDYPQNIILFIGDGMGVAHISAAKITAGILHLERFPFSGILDNARVGQMLIDRLHKRKTDLQ
jgi:hypothetical protein